LFRSRLASAIDPGSKKDLPDRWLSIMGIILSQMQAHGCFINGKMAALRKFCSTLPLLDHQNSRSAIDFSDV
ncbi:MAG TPA: hypothetical protein DCE30_15565, partial [Pantoea sp.]|nr:hypothetical protein [Pantoea sp.]